MQYVFEWRYFFSCPFITYRVDPRHLSLQAERASSACDNLHPSSSLTLNIRSRLPFLASSASCSIPPPTHKPPFIPVHPSASVTPKPFCSPVSLQLSGLLPRQQSDGFVFIRPRDLPSSQALATQPWLWITFAPSPRPHATSARAVDDL